MNKRQEMLVITMEECAELSQACSKLIRFEDDQSEQDIKNLQDEILSRSSFRRCRRRGQEGPTTTPSPAIGPAHRVLRRDLERVVRLLALKRRLDPEIRQQRRAYGAQLQPWQPAMRLLRREPASPWRSRA